MTSHQNRNGRILKLISKLKDQFGIEHIALWLNDKIYACSAGWYNIHDADKSLLLLYQLVNKDAIIHDIPVYLTHTSLVEDMSQIGKVPYRFVIMQLSEIFSLTLVSDPTLDINELY